MPYFEVVVERSQSQFQTFVVEAKDQKALEARLEELDFSEVDERFDEGEVESIDYTVSRVSPAKKSDETFASDDLQNLID